MKKRNTLPPQNLLTDIPLLVQDVHSHKYYILSSAILRLHVTDHIVTAILNKPYPPSPVLIHGSLTGVMHKLPYHYFIQVRQESAVSVLFIHHIEGTLVLLNDHEKLVFSKRFYSKFINRA